MYLSALPTPFPPKHHPTTSPNPLPGLCLITQYKVYNKQSISLDRKGMLTVSQSHLSHLNKVISTQHKLLKLRLDPSDRQQLTELFLQFQRLNSKLNTIYSNLQMGTISIEDKLAQELKQQQMLQQVEDIQETLQNIQIQKQNLEQSLLTYKKDNSQQTLAISKLTTELNKLSTDKLMDKEKLREYKERSKEFKEVEESNKVYKKQIKILKEKVQTLEEKCRLLEAIQREKDEEIGDELDRELEELEHQIQDQ